MKRYVENTIENIIQESKSIKAPKDYVDNKRKRIELVNFYKKILNLGSSFPSIPEDMKLSVARTMSKDVSNSCPQCVRPSVMLSTVKDSIRVILKYVKYLEEVDLESCSDETKGIHDLRPNI